MGGGVNEGGTSVMKIFVDIDNTICTQESDYKDAKPIQENIDKINMLYDEGNTIVYWTARGSSSGTNWASVTCEQLKRWGAKYHSVLLTKPSYDILIDDRSKRIEEI